MRPHIKSAPGLRRCNHDIAGVILHSTWIVTVYSPVATFCCIRWLGILISLFLATQVMYPYKTQVFFLRCVLDSTWLVFVRSDGWLQLNGQTGNMAGSNTFWIASVQDQVLTSLTVQNYSLDSTGMYEPVTSALKSRNVITQHYHAI